MGGEVLGASTALLALMLIKLLVTRMLCNRCCLQIDHRFRHVPLGSTGDVRLEFAVGQVGHHELGAHVLVLDETSCSDGGRRGRRAVTRHDREDGDRRGGEERRPNVRWWGSQWR